MTPERRSNCPSPRQATRSVSGSLAVARARGRGSHPADIGFIAGSVPIEAPWDATVVTARLCLRPWSIDDFGAMAALLSRPESLRFPNREAPDDDEVWARLLRQIGHWAEFGYGFWAVEERATGAVIGEAGFALFRRGPGSRHGSLPEATWTIASHCQGRGYATEAAIAGQQWLNRHLGLARTRCMIHPGNAPSLAVASKLGYRNIRADTHRRHPVIFLERHESEWAANRARPA